MVIAVLERRGEIGLRRAIGAKRRHIAAQVLAEATLVALIGGGAGALLGALATAAYATARRWPATLSAEALVSSVAIAILIGAAGVLCPALKAARLSPAEALRSM
jgi:putative ABC transport system permease protein